MGSPLDIPEVVESIVATLTTDCTLLEGVELRLVNRLFAAEVDRAYFSKNGYFSHPSRYPDVQRTVKRIVLRSALSESSTMYTCPEECRCSECKYTERTRDIVRRLLLRANHIEKNVFMKVKPRLVDAALQSACEGGGILVLRLLYELGADIKYFNKFDQFTPRARTSILASTAIRYGHTDVLQFLLQHGAVIDASSTRQNTPWFEVTAQGFSGMLQVMLEGCGQELTTQSRADLLSWAQLAGDRDIFEILLRWCLKHDTTGTFTKVAINCRHIIPDDEYVNYSVQTGSQVTESSRATLMT